MRKHPSPHYISLHMPVHYITHDHSISPYTKIYRYIHTFHFLYHPLNEQPRPTPTAIILYLCLRIWLCWSKGFQWKTLYHNYNHWGFTIFRPLILYTQKFTGPKWLVWHILLYHYTSNIFDFYQRKPSRFTMSLTNVYRLARFKLKTMYIPYVQEVYTVVVIRL